MNKIKLIIVSMLLLTSISANAERIKDERIYGVWEVVSYRVYGKAVATHGLMMITPKWFMVNITFDHNGDGILEGNANSGPYYIEDNKIILTQWMEIHWRPTEEDNFIFEGPVEKVPYVVTEDRLIFHFGTGHNYISVRLKRKGGGDPAKMF